MSNDGRYYLERALQYWQAGKPREAGRLLFENMPEENRPRWATRILELVVNKTGVKSAPVERILYIGKHPTEWHMAHEAFCSARRLGLKLREAKVRSTETIFLCYHLGLAEVVAKVIYNGTNPRDEFDRDAGWWIPECLKQILDSVNDEEFSKSMWSALCFDTEGNEQG